MMLRIILASCTQKDLMGQLILILHFITLKFLLTVLIESGMLIRMR